MLKNVSFTAPAGSTTALVGSSGSGKSTLISLAMNFNQPLSGKIRIDGRDLQTLRLRDFRSYLGVVMQDNFLFDGTLPKTLPFPIRTQRSTRSRKSAVSLIVKSSSKSLSRSTTRL